MAKENKAPKGADTIKAEKLLQEEWDFVSAKAESPEEKISFVEDSRLEEIIHSSVNHDQVSYRFCLPTQILGKLVQHSRNCLFLQKGNDDVKAWDARSLASKVIAPFNTAQESVLGSSQDPYVGNAMRQSRMSADDRNKKDLKGWNKMVDLLQEVESTDSEEFTLKIFRQILLEMLLRQRSQRFTYSVPLRISLEDTLELVRLFLVEKSGGDRALSISGALFESIGQHFHIFSRVRRFLINASDTSTQQVADLECYDEDDHLVMAIEVKDRELSLSDIEGTLQKAKQREISEIFFTAPKLDPTSTVGVTDRVQRSFASGQNLYVFDILELGRAVLALGGEKIRITFLKNVGRQLDDYNTQPRHRQAWQKLLSKY